MCQRTKDQFFTSQARVGGQRVYLSNRRQGQPLTRSVGPTVERALVQRLPPIHTLPVQGGLVRINRRIHLAAPGFPLYQSQRQIFMCYLKCVLLPTPAPPTAPKTSGPHNQDCCSSGKHTAYKLRRCLAATHSIKRNPTSKATVPRNICLYSY